MRIPVLSRSRPLRGALPDVASRPLLAGSFVVVALLVGAPASGQDRTGEIDELFRWATLETPGCAVGVSHDGEVVVSRAYGLADLERGVPIGPNTVFDIGSVQKQFVAAAVLLLVQDGTLALSDDVRRHVPELPDYGHQITLDHLLTHTSGLRDWVALENFSSGDEDALTLILRQRGLNFAPGEEWSYSNSGYVLLKEIVARASGMSFSEFARRRLFEPLGMKATMYAPDIRAATNGALAYEQQGDGWRPDMMLGDERGGGAVLSTVGDLLIWNEALTGARLGAFVTEKLQQPTRLNNGRELSYARGLFLDKNRGGRVIWHTGSARGYKALLSRYPEQSLSIAVLCNAGDASDRMEAAVRIFDLFVPGTRTADAETDSPAPAADAGADDGPAVAEGIDVIGRAGLFLSVESGEPLRLVATDDRLRIAGGPPLVAVATDRFRNPNGTLRFRSEDELELRFVSAHELELRSMEGETKRYRRAEPYTPTAAELEALAGRYESDELGAVFELVPGDDAVAIRLNGSQTIEFTPVARDTFQRGPMTVRFRRDETGKVVTLDYSNPILRAIPFLRSSNAGGDADRVVPEPPNPPRELARDLGRSRLDTPPSPMRRRSVG